MSFRVLRDRRLMLAFGIFAILSFCPTVRAQGPVYPNESDRFGVGLQPKFGAITDYDVASLGIHWYSDWTVNQDPPLPGGMEYAQLVWVSKGAFYPPLAQLGPIVDANPGSLWLIGNEPEAIWQSCNTPQQYAEAYHQLHGFIKDRDPTAQVAIGGVVQPTPLRLQWLDRVLSHYQAVYGVPMQVDVWNIHMQILQELEDSWGCEIPCGLDAAAGRLYTVQDNDNIEVFRQLVVEFRTWMRDRGQRDKPLIISEYGVLMPVEYGFTPQRVSAFMDGTFNYLLAARDGDLGYPQDENRLVQRWLWYSLNEKPYDLVTGEGFNGALYDYRYPQYPGVLTAVGIHFKEYMTGLEAPCTIEGQVTMQRPERPAPDPSWSVPLTVTVCSTAYQTTTDSAGRFTVSGITSGTCDILVKGAHTLGNVWHNYNLIPGLNAIDMGELREGDANGDDCANILDFSLLALHFMDYDPRVDFNEDGIVDIRDFSLLVGNFAKCGHRSIAALPSGGAASQRQD